MLLRLLPIPLLCFCLIACGPSAKVSSVVDVVKPGDEFPLIDAALKNLANYVSDETSVVNLLAEKFAATSTTPADLNAAISPEDFQLQLEDFEQLTTLKEELSAAVSASNLSNRAARQYIAGGGSTGAFGRSADHLPCYAAFEASYFQQTAELLDDEYDASSSPEVHSTVQYAAIRAAAQRQFVDCVDGKDK